MMDWHHISEKVLITGKSGSGKTTFWLKRVKESEHDYLFVFDPDTEFAQRAKLPITVEQEGMIRSLEETQSVIYDPTEMFPGDRQAGFDFFSEWCFEISKTLEGTKLFCCDELQKFVRQSPAYVPTGFQRMLDEGRRYNLDLLLVARRVNRVNEAVRAELTEVITFCHTDKCPLDWLSSDDIGFDRDEVRNLAVPGGFLSKELS